MKACLVKIAYLNFESEIEFLLWKSLIDTLSQASRNNSAVTVETEDAPVQSNRDEGLTHMWLDQWGFSALINMYFWIKFKGIKLSQIIKL